MANRSSPQNDIEPAQNSSSPTEFKEAIAAVVDNDSRIGRVSDSNREWAMEACTEDARMQLANVCRPPSRKEAKSLQKSTNTEYWARRTCQYSVLYIAVSRNQRENVEYLLRTCKVDLYTPCGVLDKPVLQATMRLGRWNFTRMILTSNSMPQFLYINNSDISDTTALHELIEACIIKSNNDRNWTFEMSNENDILRLLLWYGANIDAMTHSCTTPLHQLVSEPVNQGLKSLLQCLLDFGAEVNTKDDHGNTPLHTACKIHDEATIVKLLDFGADMDCQNLEWKTPREVFESVPAHNTSLAKTEFSRLQRRIPSRKKPAQVLDRIAPPSWEQENVCRNFPINFRYQGRISPPRLSGSTPMSWITKDMKVFDVLYLGINVESHGLLEEQEREFAEDIWDQFSDQRATNQDLPNQQANQSPDEVATDEMPDTMQQSATVPNETRSTGGDDVQQDSWKWINVPANNMTWIKDFILQNSGKNRSQTWEFFEESIKLCETNDLGPRVREPHAHLSKAITSLDSMMTDRQGSNRQGGMMSLVIPFIDFETAGYIWHMPKTWRRFQQLEQAYSPFTGMNGVQMPQTLDETSNKTGRFKKLGTKENQVIYRWSQKRIQAKKDQRPKTWNNHRWDLLNLLMRLLSTIWPRIQQTNRHALEEKTKRTRAMYQNISPGLLSPEWHGNRMLNASRTQKLRQDFRSSWLVVRQLWLWKLDDETILTAIPSRKSSNGADDLLETIRQSNLDRIASADRLMEHIMMQTLRFTEEFRWAGLGRHVLDIFQSEITFEANEEVRFFNDFTNADWKPEYVNKAIQEAAESTWRLKDIRDELRLILKVVEDQLKVLKEFYVSWRPEDAYYRSQLRDSGLDAMIERISDMDKEASTILEGLGSITQAMQAQASLKEAETARTMNLILLPFTVVTVVFTPLSFVTSLFAVNSDSFPHNDDGELRLPSSWLAWRLVVGEIGTLLPLLILVVSIYYIQRGKRYIKEEEKMERYEEIIADSRI